MLKRTNKINNREEQFFVIIKYETENKDKHNRKVEPKIAEDAIRVADKTKDSRIGQSHQIKIPTITIEHISKNDSEKFKKGVVRLAQIK